MVVVVCAAVVVTVIVVFTILFGPVPVADAVPQLASAGKPLHVKLMAVLKPVEAMMPTVVVPDMPGLATLTLLGPETPANPGWIVKLADCALLLGLKLLSPA